MSSCSLIADVRQIATPHEKIDDEDGHYVVVEDTPIGDRCMDSPTLAAMVHITNAAQIKSADC